MQLEIFNIYDDSKHAASKLSNPDRVANAPMNPIIKSASSEAPVKKIVQVSHDCLFR